MSKAQSGMPVFVSILFLAITASAVSGQTVWYVDDSSTSGLNDGTSWENAFVELQSALHVATNDHEIRVAQGIYKPDFDVNSNGHTGNRGMSFELISGVRLYGGYAGNGFADPNFRDTDNYVTILSGDIYDTNDFSNNEESSYHVLVADAVNSTGIIDGFTITSGYANGADSDRYGGGLYIANNSTLTFKNCIFNDNKAELGGGIYICENSTPSFKNCLLIGNLAAGGFSGHGGGVYNASSSPFFTNCKFDNNSAFWAGGGMYNIESSPALVNCTFLRNNAYGYISNGGGLYNASYSNPTISNCTFCSNSADDIGGGICNYDNSSPTLINSIIWGNADAYGFKESAQIYNEDGSCNPAVSFCCIQGLDVYIGNRNISENPLLTRDSLHLLTNSPCIDKGDPYGNYVGQYDLDREPRLVGSQVDIGSDEFLDTDYDGLPDWWENLYFGSPITALPGENHDADDKDNLSECAASSDPLNGPLTYYVSISGNDSWDGLSCAWNGINGPKATIQAAIDAAHQYEGDTVIVLPGTYTGNGNRDLDYGGKVLVIRCSDPIDPVIVRQTIIDCEGSEQEWHRGFWFHSFEGSDSILSGITINGGYAGSGGGIRCAFSSPTINHCTFTKNKANGSNFCLGGGVYAYGSSPILANCAFSGNSADYGGGMYNFGCNPTITNCEFRGNSADDGGGIYNYCSSNLTVTNCTFSGNWTRFGSGGIYNDPNFNNHTTLTCCVLWNNSGRNSFDESEQIGGSTYSISYCCIQGLNVYSGNGNIDDDPLLTRDQVHLSSSSPCINQGDPNFSTTGQLDIDGETRIEESRVDIGVDEFVDTDEDGLPDWWEFRYFESTTAAFPDENPDGDARNNLVEYTANTDPLKNPVVYYVSLSGNDSWDGLSADWNGEHGPKLTIQSGIDTADPNEGDTLIILTGTYSGNGNRDLDFAGKRLTVRSIDPANPMIVSQTIIDCEGNEEEPHRGFMFHTFENSDSVLSGVTIRGGYTNEGGGIKCEFSSPMLTNCVVKDNTAGQGGGMFNSYGSSPTLSNCTFISNSTYLFGGGGGMCNIGNSNPIITNCTFSHNSANSWGGGMHNSFDSNPTLANCKFICNSTTGTGGALVNRKYSNPDVTNCTFQGNTAGESGGGIYNYQHSSPIVANCTFTGNSVGETAITGGGISNKSASSPTIINCIVWRNFNREGSGESAQIYNDDSACSPTVSHCCIQGLETYNGYGNIGDAPSFIETNGLDGIPGTEDDDLRLQPGSPCINAGDNSAIPAEVATDLDGLPRVHACIVDMGAYEYQENHYFGDTDENCIVDIDDYLDFSFCLDRFGYEKNSILEACIQVFDSDADGDVDLADFAAFQRVFDR